MYLSFFAFPIQGQEEKKREVKERETKSLFYHSV